MELLKVAKCQQVKISDFLPYHGARKENWTVLIVDHQTLSTLVRSLIIFGIKFKLFLETKKMFKEDLYAWSLSDI